MTKTKDKTITVTVPGAGREAPVRLNHNGRLLEIERNTPTKVSRDQLQALQHSEFGPSLIVDGETAEEETAPAPAASGDAGGGGASSGDGPAAVTPPAGEVALPENFLNRSAKDIAADLATLSPAQLAKAKADEEAGKTRKSVIASIDEAIAKAAEAANG